jgi:hypothetical protein
MGSWDWEDRIGTPEFGGIVCIFALVLITCGICCSPAISTVFVVLLRNRYAVHKKLFYHNFLTSKFDGCIVFLVEGGACKTVVAGMECWHGSSGVVACAVELLSNFGAIEDEELHQDNYSVYNGE